MTADTTKYHTTWRMLPAYLAAPHILFIATYYIHIPTTIRITTVFTAIATGTIMVIKASSHRTTSCTTCVSASIDATDHPHRYLPAFRVTHLLMLPSEYIAKWMRIQPEQSATVKLVIFMALSSATIISRVIAVAFAAPWPWKFLAMPTSKPIPAIPAA